MKRKKGRRRRRNERRNGECVTLAGHELRTPLTSITGSLGLLIGGAAGELPSSAVRFLQIAYNNTQRLLRLIGDVSDPEILGSEQGVRGFPQRLRARRHPAAAVYPLPLRPIANDRPRVLHVDDDGDVLHVVAEVLRADAYIVSARSIKEARRALASGDIDLVVIDLALADGEGLDLLPELRKTDGKAIPTIVFSGDPNDTDMVEGVDAVLPKSRTSLDRLTAILRQIAAEGSAARSAGAVGPCAAQARRREVA